MKVSTLRQLIYPEAKNVFFPCIWKISHLQVKNCMYFMILHVKLQPKQTKYVEMRAKSVWQVKFMDFFNAFFEFFNFAQFSRYVSMKNKNVVIPNRVIEYQNVPDSLKFCHLS